MRPQIYYPTQKNREGIMSDNKETSVKKLITLFDRVINLLDKFVQKVDKDIIQPFASGQDTVVERNLKKIGSSISISQLLKLIIKTFEDLVSARVKIDKNYADELRPSFDIKEASKNLDDKLKDLFKYKSLPAQI
jgi:hypothetical protein